MDKVKYAIVGCGSVAGARYFNNIDVIAAAGGQLAAVCDSYEERAKPRAEQFGVPYYLDLDEMLAKADFDLLANLTHAQAHYAVILKSIRAGKHIYTQKPMTVTVDESTTLIEEAAGRNLKLVAEEVVGVLPRTRTMRKLIDEDVIGKVTWVRSTSTHVGPAYQDNWPTDPSWYYQKGSGPSDPGIERIHLVTALLGPAKRVTAVSGINQPEVVVQTGPAKGKRVIVEADDVTMISLDFGDSIYAVLDMAWINVRGIRTPHLEIYGQKGVICWPRDEHVPLELYREEPRLGIRGWTEVSLIPASKPDPPRAVAGLVHAVECILEEKEPIPSGEHARHCIEILTKAFVAARTGMTQEVETTF